MDKDALLEDVLSFYENNPFVKLLDIEIVTEEGKMALSLEIRKELTNPYGFSHGGVLLSLADTGMGAVCLLAGKKVVTLSLAMDFLRPAQLGDKLNCAGKILKLGKRIINCEISIFNANEELVAKSHGSFFVIGDM